jgi:type IV secretory pathway ATPase VirB11/archaellum biosynthesis ATPase
MLQPRIEQVGDRRVLLVDCHDYKGSLSLAESDFLSKILPIVADAEADEMVLVKDFKRVFQPGDYALLRELALGAREAKAAFKIPEETLRSCEVDPAERMRKLTEIAALLDTNPLAAYYRIVEESNVPVPDKFKFLQWRAVYAKALEPARNALAKTGIVKRAVAGEGENVLLTALRPWVIPGFVTAYIDLTPPEGRLIEAYKVGKTEVSIYELAKRPEKMYHVKPPELLLHDDENAMVNAALERIAKEKSELVNPRQARKHFKDLGRAFLDKHATGLSEERKEELADIVARYSAGYGLLEVMLWDERLQDVFVDSPGKTPVYVYHEKYEECVTNVAMSEYDLEKLGARFRAISGRPFDESSPVLHAELTDLNVRICGLCPPATFEGIGFAFRRGRPRPWTLPQFIKAGMIDWRSAGLLSFLVDSQASILVTGPRGSGKTSLLASLLSEVNPNYRVIVIEDTPELPIQSLQEHNFKVQHVKTQPAFGGEQEKSFELTAEEALRTALRLGESVLVIGEVRGPEARALFEAMRIGAAGNVVFGTIHGSSAYDTWDRIVNDLGVPSTSFKATDVVVSAASIREKQGIRRKRKVVSVTEVRKDWKSDPFHEDGFKDLVKYDVGKDRWLADLKHSTLLQQIGEKRGMSVKEMLADIDYRGRVKKLLVEKSVEYDSKELLEVATVAECNIEAVKAVAEAGYGRALARMAAWIDAKARAAKAVVRA